MTNLKCACGERYCSDSAPYASDGSHASRTAIRSFNKMMRRSQKRKAEREAFKIEFENMDEGVSHVLSK